MQDTAPTPAEFMRETPTTPEIAAEHLNPLMIMTETVCRGIQVGLARCSGNVLWMDRVFLPG